MVEKDSLVGLDTDRYRDSGYSLSEIRLYFLKVSNEDDGFPDHPTD